MFAEIVTWLENLVWSRGIPVGDQTIPFIVIALLGTGLFLTLRLGFIQIRRLGHGFAVTSGKYDDPEEPGDVSHFQALTTALSATVGIGNIAGVAIAIHWGGPGALFWMWMTAALGMALKYSEVTLAQKYRQVEFPDQDAAKWEGSVSGGPMYYIERGLGKKWKPMAVFFAAALIGTSFLTGNAVQANTVADVTFGEFGLAPWITGLLSSTIVALVILGGIKRIGNVTAVLAPLMAIIYVGGALIILGIYWDHVLPSIGLIFREAFNPSAGVAGTGTGAVLLTMMWGVKRGLFSNEAGQGSAPIAHAAAKTDEPVSEGVVALLEPFIDTLVICTMTGLVVIATGVWNERHPTVIELSGGDLSYVTVDAAGANLPSAAPAEILYRDGRPAADGPRVAWHDVAVETLFTDAAREKPFDGKILPGERRAVGDDGASYAALHGLAVENGAPLTTLAFMHGLPGTAGRFIVIISVMLFAVSTAISWSYYGDRCANYLFGVKAILPYRIVYVAMHFIGAVLSLDNVWKLGDIALGFVVLPNLIAVVLLSGQIKQMTDGYFERKPWIQNAEDHKRWVSAHKKK